MFLQLRDGQSPACPAPRYRRVADPAGGTFRRLKSTDPTVRIDATHVLSAVNGVDEADVGTLVEALDDPVAEVRRTAIRALEGARPTIVPALIRKLRDHDGKTRMTAAQALANLGPSARPAAAALGRTLRDRGQDTWPSRPDGHSGRIEPEPDEVIPALVEALRNPRWKVRREAVGVAGIVRPCSPRRIFFALTDLAQRDKEPFVREAAVAAIGGQSLGPDAAAVVPTDGPGTW